jgi:hypothetical protein
VALLPRSTEIQPYVASIRPSPLPRIPPPSSATAPRGSGLGLLSLICTSCPVALVKADVLRQRPMRSPVSRVKGLYVKSYVKGMWGGPMSKAYVNTLFVLDAWLSVSLVPFVIKYMAGLPC